MYNWLPAIVKMADKPSTNKPRVKRTNKPSNNHNLKKRQPPKPEKGQSVFYVNTKSNIKASLERADKLLINKETNEIIIHCLGAAIQRGILLALQLSEKQPSLNIETNTLTTELIDDLEPAADDADYEIQRRFNSALRIRLFRSTLLAPKQESAQTAVRCSSESTN